MDINKLIEGKTLTELQDIVYLLQREITRRQDVRFRHIMTKMEENNGNKGTQEVS